VPDLWLPDFEVTIVEVMGQEWPTAYLVSKWERNAIGERRFTGETRTYRDAATLRAALDELRPLAKSGASRAHLMESGVMVRHNGTLWECEAERCIAARELAWTPEERAAKIAALATANETP